MYLRNYFRQLFHFPGRYTPHKIIFYIESTFGRAKCDYTMSLDGKRQMWFYKLLPINYFCEAIILRFTRATCCHTVQQHMRFTMRSRIRVNEPVIAKCITWNNSLVLVFFTNDITLYSYKTLLTYLKDSNVCQSCTFYYALGRSPIHLNIFNINNN